jgi:hypothetical protein
MTKSMSIRTAWLDLEHGSAREKATFGDLTFQVGERFATETEDLVARTVQRSARLSGVHLAEWLVGNWWRLSWESRSNTRSWQMSHHLAAAGGGYQWPNIMLESDGFEMKVSVKPSVTNQAGLIRYLSVFDAGIPVSAFQSAVDAFVSEVVTRMDRLGVDDGNLGAVWRELQNERANPEVSWWRRLEATLGYDVDDAPEELLTAVGDSAQAYGLEATAEIAAAAQSRSVEFLTAIAAVGKSSPLEVVVPQDASISQSACSTSLDDLPWMRATRAAHAARTAWNISAGPITDAQLSDILGTHFDSNRVVQHTAPLTAGIRRSDSKVGVVFRTTRHRTNRRFDLARVIGDQFAPGHEHDMLLPATATRTARQKFQRAFAQEFLCPYQELQERLDASILTDEFIEDSARDYGVSPLVVQTLLVNKDVLERATLY